MKRKGILIDYEFCTGCHSCEVACQMEHDLDPDRFGIKVNQIGPWKLGEDNYEFTFLPYPTKLCNLCAERTASGKEPTCVKHCLAQVIRYGDIDDLAAALHDKPRQVLYALE